MHCQFVDPNSKKECGRPDARLYRISALNLSPARSGFPEHDLLVYLCNEHAGPLLPSYATEQEPSDT